MADVSAKLKKIDKRIMSSLKDFQRATVERIDYLYKHGQKRILVSDEVGLGKTLIARGTVAKVALLRKKEGDDLVKVVYICSNAAIAEQNLNRLRITSELRLESAGSSRLSMQHLNIFNQENDAEVHERFIQLIPLTPDTSFRMSSRSGTVKERALMFVFLKRIPNFRRYAPELEEIMRRQANVSWKSERDSYETEADKCNKRSHGQYFAYMKEHLQDELKLYGKNGKTLSEEVTAVLKAVREEREDNKAVLSVLSRLRVSFAKISLEKLEPDLVIMDEFQRFKYLLDAEEDTDLRLLTDKFFGSENVRMLLLSATPYKMYSTLEEIDENNIDEHYSEFRKVMEFLNKDNATEKEFFTIWDNYCVKLIELSEGDRSIIAAKNAAEDEMYKTVCRTERISEESSSDMIDDSETKTSLKVLDEDITSYLEAQHLLEQIDAKYSVPVDYVKSSPYLMSFMRDYQMKRSIEKYFERYPEDINLMNKRTFWINRSDLDKYKPIPRNNARLDKVMKKTLEGNMDKLLWIPPSKPYYESQGVFKHTEHFTKTLIFSSWEMVPRMIASMISYEAERRTVGVLAKNNDERSARYFYSKDERRYPSARMNFTMRKDTPGAMNLFCLLYPSRFLTDVYDPLECMNQKLSWEEIRKRISQRISLELRRFPSQKSGNPDQSWYYLAPMLLDDEEYVTDWLNSKYYLADYDNDEATDKQKGFLSHMTSLIERYSAAVQSEATNLGKRPDDLIDILTDMAVASPAVCVNRTYEQYAGVGSFESYLPSNVARIFINRMNTAEATAAVELACGRRSDDAHWQNLLKYCRQGNLQAVFDEYIHLLSNGLDRDENFIQEIHLQIISALNIRTTPYKVDTFDNFRKRINDEKEKETNIRTHYAVAFTKGDNKESDTDRKRKIRNAFNSPFRPFVLATTSIGQEGLDFHNYCRRIVHWNLPSNPIDLEQREGRINRFECLAIRQNVAERYGNIQFHSNVWQEMFDEAKKVEQTDNCSELIPYWGLKETEGMVKIERIVPMYPFSRDVLSYERLIKILSLYRLTLGHARQEELLEHLFKNFDNTEELHDLFINLSPYYKGLK